MRIVSVSEMVAIEEKANAEGLDYEQMMHNAGTSLAEIVMVRFGGCQPGQVLGLVGSGNNGGDTLIALEILQKSGWKTSACLLKGQSVDDGLLSSYANAGGVVLNFGKDSDRDALIRSIRSSSVILDGVLGTGFRLPLRDNAAKMLSLVANYSGTASIVAVDCPSGVDCDTGECAPETLRADMTVCMAAVKQGLVRFPAVGLVGEIVPADIGLPDQAFSTVSHPVTLAESQWVSAILPERQADAHKGIFGQCMIIGGSIQYPGAPLLSAESAYRVGAGLVCTAIPGAIYDGLVGRLPESTWLMLPHELGMLNDEAAKIVLKNIEKTDVVLVGPGMGFEKPTEAFMRSLLSFGNHSRQEQTIGFMPKSPRLKKKAFLQPKLVLDADALRILPSIDGWQHKIKETAVLTPHPGEMAALTGLTTAEVQDNRIEIARKLAVDSGHVIVLKGAVTVIASPQDEVMLVPIATPALATAGSGDVLAGMITGLLAQGMEAFHGAVAAAWLHGAAGLSAGNSHGQTMSIIARDILNHIQQVLKRITAR